MSKEAMKLALEALGLLVEERSSEAMDDGYKAIKALEEALAKQEQGEPVAWGVHDQISLNKTLAENSQQRTWVGLTDEEQTRLFTDWDEDKGWGPFIEAIESKLKEKNT
jgi:hypothetical protein